MSVRQPGESPALPLLAVDRLTIRVSVGLGGGSTDSLTTVKSSAFESLLSTPFSSSTRATILTRPSGRPLAGTVASSELLLAC